MDATRFLSQLHYLFRAFIWLAVVGLAVVLGKTVMEQLQP